MLWLSRLQLRSSKAEARRKALERLCAHPHPGAFAALQTALTDPDPEVRSLAAKALGKLEDPRGIVPLLSALSDRSTIVVRAAIDAVKRSNDERINPALKPLLRHSDASVRGAAAQILIASRWAPGAVEDEIWLLVAGGQFTQAAGFGIAAIPALENALDHGPASISVNAVAALASIGGPKVVRPLLRTLKYEDSAVCIAAITGLSNCGDPAVRDAIKGLLRHSKAQVRLAAMEATAELGLGEDSGIFQELLGDVDWDVRRAAAEMIGRLKDTHSLEALAATLKDSDADVRETAAIALGNLGDRRAIEPLVMGLADSTSVMRRIAAGALSRLDPDWATSPEARIAAEQLRPTLGEKDPDVRYFVRQLLGLDKEVAAGSPGDAKSPFATGEDISAARRRLAVNLFLEILCDPDRDLRQAAAEALGKIGEVRAKSALFRACSDSDEGVRLAAKSALSSLGGEDN
jgi:HEAT repeat protein